MAAIARLSLLSWVGVLTLLAGCASSSGSKRVSTSSPPEPFVRVARPDADTFEFQTAIRRYVPARGSGPEIWLVGASHIGDSNYFAALQQHLDARSLVLFEGIKQLEDGAKPPPAPVPTPKQPAVPPSAPAQGTLEADASTLQISLAKSLGLVFQLDALDYSRPHFRNSDLSAAQIQTLMAAPHPGKPKPGQPGEPQETGFQSLVQLMQGTSLLGAVANAVLDVIGSSPHLQALTRLAMIEVLGGMDDDLAQLQGLPPDLKQLLEVLIRERNQAVIADLWAALKTQPIPKSISVIYGVGHLPDMEQRLRRKMNYRPAGTTWLTAFWVNTRAAGISGWEVTFVRSLLRTQMQEMKPSGRK